MSREISVNEFCHRAVVDDDPTVSVEHRGGGRFIDDGEPEIEVASDAGRADEVWLSADQAVDLAFASRAATKPLDAHALSKGLRSVMVVRDGEPQFRRSDVARVLAGNNL